ncbi:hypothetical protein BU26DRAFT_562798 [Trematosphaeria pertusa]|uniref:Uncharacterized protein n=1 Tax=Trematosphaeria pertusa TaxID=390896 RepID=A0A6A6IMN5_9PLEO|nr:uncharacterized protein BU26DRAFT_562798 [Trematosphaeria pertusa]KAF2250830.1 hypothetical protein BU26DRAFT_562798 [Trematosphaeria pertusa]
MPPEGNTSSSSGNQGSSETQSSGLGAQGAAVATGCATMCVSTVAGACSPCCCNIS